MFRDAAQHWLQAMEPVNGIQAREVEKLPGAGPASIPEEERDQASSSADPHRSGLDDTDRTPSTLDKQIAQERAAAGSETLVTCRWPARRTLQIAS